MWIALVFVVFTSGNVFQDYGFADTEAECMKQITDMETKLAEAPEIVVGYNARCIHSKEMKRAGTPS